MDNPSGEAILEGFGGAGVLVGVNWFPEICNVRFVHDKSTYIQETTDATFK